MFLWVIWEYYMADVRPWGVSKMQHPAVPITIQALILLCGKPHVFRQTGLLSVLLVWSRRWVRIRKLETPARKGPTETQICGILAEAYDSEEKLIDLGYDIIDENIDVVAHDLAHSSANASIIDVCGIIFHNGMSTMNLLR